MTALLRLKVRLIILAVVAVLLIVGFSVAGMMLLVMGGGQGALPAARVDCTVPGAPGAAPEAPAEIKAQQIENAKLIDQAAEKAGLSGKASRIAIVAAMGESTLINLDYGDQVNGVRNPDGSLATSFGLFQQQTSQGWGTKEQVMDPLYATTSFLKGPNHDGKRGLVSIAGWEDTDYVSSVIHQVQGNSNRDHYTASVGPADKIIAEAGIDVGREGDEAAQGDLEPADATGEALDCGGSSGSVDPADANDDYPWIASTPGPGVHVADPVGYFYGECTSYAAWRINRDAGSTTEPFKYSSAAGNFSNGNGADWQAAWLARGWKVSSVPVPGAVAWWAANDGVGIGPAGHVAYVEEVTTGGKAIISEYNNSGLAPPGHKYSLRPEPVDPSEVSGFLYPPPND